MLILQDMKSLSHGSLLIGIEPTYGQARSARRINCSLRSRNALTQRSKLIQLGSRRITYQGRRHLPSTRVARQRQIWAPPSGKTLLASLAQNHIPRQASSANRSHCLLVAPPGGRSQRHLVARNCLLRSRRFTYQARRHLPITRVARWCRPLVADKGATWWQGSYGLAQPSTKVSTQLARRQLSNGPAKNTRRHACTHAP